MRAVIVLLLVGLALAGCTEKAPSEPIVVDDAVLPPAPEDLLIEESGSLAEGFANGWTFEVEPGFQRMDVTLELLGPDGLPQYVAIEWRAALVHRGIDKDAQRFGGSQSSAGATVSSGTSGCVICVAPTTDDEGAGTWVLSLEAEPSLADYRVRISVDY